MINDKIVSSVVLTKASRILFNTAENDRTFGHSLIHSNFLMVDAVGNGTMTVIV